MSQSVAVASVPDGAKRGALFGGALSDEALDSSRSVLGAHRGAGQRGLQQFFTPPEAADFVQQIIDPYGRSAVLDPTAGNGALLSPWRQELRFGIEIDPDQVRHSAYNAIRGDVQRAFPMLVKLGVRFGRVVANPPFGLTWTDGSGRAESSTVGAWRMGLALLDQYGAGAFICGRDRFHREVLARKDAAGVFATVECGDLFADVALPCLIAFFVAPENRDEDSAGVLVSAPSAKAALADETLRDELRHAMREASVYVDRVARPSGGPLAAWKLVHRELERRRREAESQRPTYDVELRAGERLSIRPSPFVRQALAKTGRLKLLETLHNQPVGHFALNTLDWRLLGELEEACDLSIAPAVREAVASVASAAEREVIPLYEVRPQMRLGYLTDLDSILCTRSDSERGFEQGQALSAAHRLAHQRHHGTEGHAEQGRRAGRAQVRGRSEGARDQHRRAGADRVGRGHPVHPRLLRGPKPRRHRDALPRAGRAPAPAARRDRGAGPGGRERPVLRMEALPARGPSARAREDPRGRRLHIELGAGRRQDARRRRLCARRGCQRCP